ncbi:MAG: CBS domain-containing protein [Bacteroidia bacterium]
MKIKDVMTAKSIKFCSPDTKLRKAAKTMKICNCGALPVVDDKKKVIGIITDRDICLSLAQEKPGALKRLRVGQIMSKKVHTVNAKDSISNAFHQMRVNKIGRLPVVDKKGKLSGIVSLHNLINKSTGNELKTNSEKKENLLKTIQALTKRYKNKEAKDKA